MLCGPNARCTNAAHVVIRSLECTGVVDSVFVGVEPYACYIPIEEYWLDMKLKNLKATLALHPAAHPRFILPDGDVIPAHFHITEVGHVAKRFIDCGGKRHDTTDTCLLQTYVADDVDHRLDARTFAKILQLGNQVLPHDDLEVEVEYDCCVVAQYPIVAADFGGGRIDIQLGEKHTDCLAKEKCGVDGGACASQPNAEEMAAASTCC